MIYIVLQVNRGLNYYSIMLRHRVAVIFFLTSVIILPVPVMAGEVLQAQPENEEIVIGTRVVAPFVIEEADGSYTGITVNLWRQIAEDLGLDYRFEATDIQGMLDGVADGSYFAAASALTITSEREEVVDFTHPFFVTGLGIAVPHRPSGLMGSLRALFSPDFWWVVLLLFGLLLFWGVLVWIFERKENTGEFGGSAAEGIGSGFWWAAVTMTTVGYGDKSPRTIGGRVVGFVWMFTAIIVISFFTASIASSLTVTQLESRVNGPQDLPNARVGVLDNSAPQAFMQEENIGAQPYSTLEDGLRGVEGGDIDAFVHDAPIISYIIQQEFRNRVRILPNTFNDQYYGIALPLDSEYRNRINQIILEIINSDEWEEMLTEYFGK
jgi:polar amino acid transport system substrate-binding protein